MKHVVLLLLLCASANACRGPQSVSETQGTVSDGQSYRWPSTSIPVCWENPSEATATAQKAVEDTVTSEYARAGLHFTGWGPCTAESRGIRIFHDDTPVRQVLAFGARLDGVPNGLQLNLTFEVTDFYGCTGADTLRCVEEDALHEFGHALGLRHEQNRLDSFCALDQTAGLGEAGALPITPYDKDSVMNYCANDLHILASKRKPRLSFLDVAALRLYYATSGSLGQRACERDGHQWYEDDLHSCCAIQSDRLQPFASRPYRSCERTYSMRFADLQDADLEGFLGADYQGMLNASSGNPAGPWLSLELACRYESFRSFGWEFYLEGDQLRDFIRNKRFPIAMMPAADLVCDGFSLENPAISGEYLKMSGHWKPSFSATNDVEGSFTKAYEPAWTIFEIKPVFMELPDLDFEPRSLLLTCDRNSYIGYFQEYGIQGPVMRFDIASNASYGPSAHVHCSRLEAFDTEIPRDATQSYRFQRHVRRLKLDTQEERFLLEKNPRDQFGARQQKPQRL